MRVVQTLAESAPAPDVLEVPRELFLVEGFKNPPEPKSLGVALVELPTISVVDGDPLELLDIDLRVRAMGAYVVHSD